MYIIVGMFQNFHGRFYIILYNSINKNNRSKLWTHTDYTNINTRMKEKQALHTRWARTTNQEKLFHHSLLRDFMQYALNDVHTLVRMHHIFLFDRQSPFHSIHSKTSKQERKPQALVTEIFDWFSMIGLRWASSSVTTALVTPNWNKCLCHFQ